MQLRGITVPDLVHREGGARLATGIPLGARMIREVDQLLETVFASSKFGL